MVRVGHVAASLKPCRDDIEDNQGAMDETRQRRIEQTHQMNGKLDDQHECAQDSYDEVVIGEAASWVSAVVC